MIKTIYLNIKYTQYNNCWHWDFTLTGLLLIYGWIRSDKMIDSDFFFRWDLFQFSDDDLNDLHYRYLTPTTKDENIFPMVIVAQPKRQILIFPRKSLLNWPSFHISLNSFYPSLGSQELQIVRFQENWTSRNSISPYY